MAKAHIVLPDGTEVNLEGTPAEISEVLKQAGSKAAAKSNGRKSAASKSASPTIPGLVSELKSEGFFKKPKGLDEIRKRLADLGHNYPVTTLSGAMQNQAKQRLLRRFKENGKYVYAQ